MKKGDMAEMLTRPALVIVEEFFNQEDEHPDMDTAVLALTGNHLHALTTMEEAFINAPFGCVTSLAVDLEKIDPVKLTLFFPDGGDRLEKGANAVISRDDGGSVAWRLSLPDGMATGDMPLFREIKAKGVHIGESATDDLSDPDLASSIRERMPDEFRHMFDGKLAGAPGEPKPGM